MIAMISSNSSLLNHKMAGIWLQLMERRRLLHLVEVLTLWQLVAI